MIRVETYDERRCCVRRHQGGVATVDETRRPMYQHMISHELVGGASILRFDDGLGDHDGLDVLIGATCDFTGDDVVTVDVLPAGDYAVREFHGPPEDLEAARHAFARDVEAQGLRPVGRFLQVHLMDEIDGELEQEFQVRLEPSDG